MIPSEYIEIITLLDKNSKEGKVRWRPAGESNLVDSAQEDDFVVITADYTINLWMTSDQEIHFTIINDVGQYVTRFSVKRDEQEYDFMYSLFSIAQNKASGGDEILNDIKMKLKQGIPLGRAKSSPEEPEDIPF